MWRSNLELLTSLLSLFVLTPQVILAKNVVYVTDLPIYNSLAPCAASAVSNNIRYQTFSKNCPEAVTDLQSCICTERFETVSSYMSLMISATCGSTATDDQSSASTVLKNYCDQDWGVSFPAPKYLVSSYIDEIPAMTQLAPCASIMLSRILGQTTDAPCPPDPTALAPCACVENQNSLRISESINSVVGSACSSNREDVKSAQAMFSAYCNMNSGLTKFPTASPPPGDMSYYITDLPGYSSLESCAQDCISIAALYKTTSLCPGGSPDALASCLCIKPSVSKLVSGELTWQIRNRCRTRMMENLSSANSIIDYYCSAAKGEVTATGVVVSQTQDTSTGDSGSLATQTNDSKESHSDKSKGASAGVIAGAVVGAIAGLLAGAVGVFCIMRRVSRQKGGRGHAGDDRHSAEGVGHDRVVRPDSIPNRDDDVTASPPPYEERETRATSKTK